MTLYLQGRAGFFFCSYSWEHYKIITAWGLSIITYFLPAWVKLCVFIRALQLKMGTRFAELGQENMPPLLPPIFLYLLLSGGALQTTKCLLHPPSKPSLHRLASHGALASAFPLKQLPPASPSSAFLSLQCSLGV